MIRIARLDPGMRRVSEKKVGLRMNVARGYLFESTSAQQGILDSAEEYSDISRGEIYDTEDGHPVIAGIMPYFRNADAMR